MPSENTTNTAAENKAAEKAERAAAKANETVTAPATEADAIALDVGTDDRIYLEGVANYTANGRQPQTRLNLSVTNAEAKLQMQKIATALGLTLRANDHANNEFFVLVDLSPRAVAQLRREQSRAIKLSFNAVITSFSAGEMVVELEDNKSSTPFKIERATILNGGRIVKERATRNMDDLGDLPMAQPMTRRRGAALARL